MVRIMCALALLLIGFAHQPPDAVGHLSAAEMAEYVLPDGTLPELCHSLHEDEAKHPGHDQATGCEVCRLTASILLPTPTDISGQPILHEAAHAAPARSEAFYRQLFPPNTSPRGPPSGITA